jgi:hypothetical protein
MRSVAKSAPRPTDVDKRLACIVRPVSKMVKNYPCKLMRHSCGRYQANGSSADRLPIQVQLINHTHIFLRCELGSFHQRARTWPTIYCAIVTPMFALWGPVPQYVLPGWAGERRTELVVEIKSIAVGGMWQRLEE